MNFVAATALAILASTAQTDTTLSVTQGARLSVFNFGGEVAVSSWNRNAVRVQAEHGSNTQVLVRREGHLVSVASRDRRSPANSVYYRISVPAWINLDVNGINNEVDVRGVNGEVVVETVRGGVEVHGGKGLVSLRSMQGGVRVEGARGRVQASSVNEGVVVLDSEGEIVVNTVNGSIVLGRIVSNLVEAMSANGDLIWHGNFKNRGRYQFGTHNGDVVVVTADGANARVKVETFNGEFESGFPVDLKRSRPGRGFNFTLGDGSALLDIESFQGHIQLLREGTEKARRALARQDRAVERQYRQKAEERREALRERRERSRERERDRERDRDEDHDH